MKKYFIFSDTHSFHDELMEALNNAGFDISNPEHIIILCGDLFDRGDKSVELYNFIRSIPTERRVLIRGNHELLLRDLLIRGYAEDYDYSNGTFGTVMQFAGSDPETSERLKYLNETIERITGNLTTLYHDIFVGSPDKDERDRVDTQIQSLQSTRRELIKERAGILYSNKEIRKVVDWIFSDDWVDYHELGKYIFVHSFVPVKEIKSRKKDERMSFSLDSLGGTPKSYGYDPNWRRADESLWEEAMWGCPFRDYLNGYFKEKGRILVCGHWHTSDFFKYLLKQEEGYEHCPIFMSKQYPGIIGLDACTAITHRVNVLTLMEDEVN